MCECSLPQDTAHSPHCFYLLTDSLGCMLLYSHKLFAHYDRDNSGSLDFLEFRGALRRDAKISRKELSDAELANIFANADADGGGEVDVDEFLEWLGMTHGGTVVEQWWNSGACGHVCTQAVLCVCVCACTDLKEYKGLRKPRRRKKPPRTTPVPAKLKLHLKHKMTAAAYTSEGVDL